MNDSGCDGVMIGRAAVRSPWIFKACGEIAAEKKSEMVIKTEEIYRETLTNIAAFLPEHLHKSRGHRFCFYFCGNFKFSHDLFTKIRKNESIADMIKTIDEYLYKMPEEREKHIEYNTG